MQQNGATVEEIKAFMIEEKKRMAAELTAAMSAASPRVYTLDQLRGKPEGLDHSKLEIYLSDAEFNRALGMTKAAFAKQPAWKQNDARKKLGIY